jgi:hypothetical protein
MLAEVKLFVRESNSPSSVLQTQERAACSTSYVSPCCCAVSHAEFYLHCSTAQRDAAIVTPIPGTTRDILSLSLDIGGLPVIISDTAGLRKTQDVIENIGIERAQQA